MHKNRIAFIVEGVKTEKQFLNKLQEVFWKPGNELDVIYLPAMTNIYTVWKRLEEDEWNTNIIDVIKEMYNSSNMPAAEKEKVASYTSLSFSEVYLFFDYDGHATDVKERYIPDIIHKMLTSFNNETENGKLYISYPMIEAIKDVPSFDLSQNLPVKFRIDEGPEYKQIISNRSVIPDYRKYDLKIWVFTLRLFIQNLKFLLQKEQISFSVYRNSVNSMSIFIAQFNCYIKPFGQVLVLSALPEFILDYFEEDFWQKYL